MIRWRFLSALFLHTNAQPRACECLDCLCAAGLTPPRPFAERMRATPDDPRALDRAISGAAA